MLKYILDGGMMMWVLLALSILGLAIIIERWRVFKIAGNDTSVMRRLIRQLLDDGKVDDAVRVCEETKGPIAAVLLVGLSRYRRLLRMNKREEEIEESVSKSMADYAPRVISELERRVGLLLMVGSVSPLVGMTGTVLGMIRAFDAMSKAESLGGGVVAGGISEALITTAAGLLIAVPAVVFYYIYSNKLERHTLTIEESATELVDAASCGGMPPGRYPVTERVSP
jgi:biopolymer transport protein ExbB/TolQ